MAAYAFADLASATVSSGGTTAPSAGTSESWTVAGVTGTFPTLVTGQVFDLVDPAAATEIMTATATASGTAWTVTRGAYGTTPVAHTTGFTVRNVVTTSAMNAVKQPGSLGLHGARLALGARAGRPMNILICGDSISEGQAASSLLTRWVQRFLQTLRDTHPVPGVVGGFGYYPAIYALTSPTGISPTVTTGTVTSNVAYGLGRRAMALGASGVLTFPAVKCTSFQVCYRQVGTPNNFSVAVDGGTAVNVGTTAVGEQSYTVSSLASTTHTVVLTNVSAGAVIEGIMYFDGDESAGIRLWDGSKFGTRADQFNSTDSGGNATWADAITRVNPDLVVVAWGTNDYTNRTAAQYQTSLGYVLTLIRGKTNASILFLSMFQKISSPVSDPWFKYADAMAAVAATDPNASFLDLRNYIPVLTTDTYSMLNVDGVHPNDKGHGAIADIVANYLTS